jgi:hypothetical protein
MRWRYIAHQIFSWGVRLQPVSADKTMISEIQLKKVNCRGEL